MYPLGTGRGNSPLAPLSKHEYSISSSTSSMLLKGYVQILLCTRYNS
jgi:hypothetical protein